MALLNDVLMNGMEVAVPEKHANTDYNSTGSMHHNLREFKAHFKANYVLSTQITTCSTVERMSSL